MADCPPKRRLPRPPPIVTRPGTDEALRRSGRDFEHLEDVGTVPGDEDLLAEAAGRHDVEIIDLGRLYHGD